MSCSTRVVTHGVDRGFAYGAVTRCGRPFQAVLLPRRFVTPPQVYSPERGHAQGQGRTSLRAVGPAAPVTLGGFHRWSSHLIVVAWRRAGSRALRAGLGYSACARRRSSPPGQVALAGVVEIAELLLIQSGAKCARFLVPVMTSRHPRRAIDMTSGHDKGAALA